MTVIDCFSYDWNIGHKWVKSHNRKHTAGSS